MKLNGKDVLKPAAILFAICVVVSAALAGTNALTADRIARQAAAKAEESRKIVMPDAASFAEMTEEDGLDLSNVYSGFNDAGEIVGYVFETSAKGYGGDVKVMTGIAVTGDITGVVILSHGETPGLGANAEKESFREQYRQFAPETGLEVVKYQEPQPGQIEAMTGATITSKAVTSAVNQAIEQLDAILADGPAETNSKER